MKHWTETITETHEQRVNRLFNIGMKTVAHGDEVGRARQMKIATHQADLLIECFHQQIQTQG